MFAIPRYGIFNNYRFYRLGYDHPIRVPGGQAHKGSRIDRKVNSALNDLTRKGI